MIWPATLYSNASYVFTVSRWLWSQYFSDRLYQTDKIINVNKFLSDYNEMIPNI